jgi:hypothetical protein
MSPGAIRRGSDALGKAMSRRQQPGWQMAVSRFIDMALLGSQQVIKTHTTI